MKLSIIVPVYNTEKYLDKCLTSLVNQTIDDFEIVVVNDGSKDDSETIINKYVKKYPDIVKYFKKENGGLSDARNFGISKASGEYIGFVDSDDYVETNMYELLLNKAKTQNFDMVVSDVYVVYPDESKKVISSKVDSDLLVKSDVKSVMTVIYPTVWNKIYKRELLEGISFSRGVWFEDIDFLYRLFSRINSIGVCNIPLYNYLQRENSITYTYNDKLYDFIHNMDNVVKFFKEENLYNEYFDELEYLYARYALATFPKRLAKCKDLVKYKEGVKYAKEKLLQSFPNYKNNKYLNELGLKGKYIKHFNELLSKINYIVNKDKKFN